MRAGKSIRQLDHLNGGEEEFLSHAGWSVATGRLRGDDVRRRRAGTSVRTQGRIARHAYHLLTEQEECRRPTSYFDPNVLAVATGIEEHNRYAVNFIEAARQIKPCCRTSKSPAA